GPARSLRRRRFHAWRAARSQRSGLKPLAILKLPYKYESSPDRRREGPQEKRVDDSTICAKEKYRNGTAQERRLKRAAKKPSTSTSWPGAPFTSGVVRRNPSHVTKCSIPGNSSSRIGSSITSALFSTKSRTRSSPSEGSREQLEKTTVPSALTRVMARSISFCCNSASFAMSSGVFVQGMSG